MSELNGESNGHTEELELESGAPEADGGSEPSYTLRDFMRARDLEVDDSLDDDALFTQLQQLAERAERYAPLGDADPAELQRFADLGRKLSPYEAQIEQLRQQATGAGVPTPPAPVGQPQPQPTPQQQAAKYDRDAIEAARATCRKNNETGLWEPLQPFYADAARYLNDAEQIARRNSERLLLDPDSYIDEQFKTREQKLREELRKEILGEFQPDIEAWRNYQTQQLQAAFLEPLEAEYIASRDATGKPTLTPKGLAFESAYEKAPQGLSEQDRLNYAKALADQWELQQSRQPSQKATPFRFAKKQPAEKPAPVVAAEDKPRDPRGRFIDAARKSQTNGAAKLPVPDRAATVRAAAARVGRREAPKPYEQIEAEVRAELGR